jgi:ribonuclease J
MLKIAPLGGLEEFGLNCMLLEHGEDRLLVDCGVMFPTAGMHGVGSVVPDLGAVLDAPERLRGIVLTHGHEDHVGALPSLLARHQIPVYGLPLTLALAKNRLDELGVQAELCPLDARSEVQLASGLSIELLRMAHSMPDAAGLVLRTPSGTIVHTGDFKLDDAPVDGHPTDLERLAELGEEGVLCLLSDSTGAEVPHPTASESVVAQSFEEIFARTEGRLILSMFASSLHRVRHTLELCARTGRKVVLMGRSLLRNVEIGRRVGTLPVPEALFVSAETALGLPRREVCVIATGAQAEPRAALSMMCHGGEHRSVLDDDARAFDAPPWAGLRVEPGDTVVLSARAIPGNEREVGGLIDRLLERGAKVIYGGTTPGVHVSGHASRPQQAQMIDTVRPRHFIPIHGERRMLHAHAALARAQGIAPDRVFLLHNGDVVGFDEGRGSRQGRLPAGRVFKDRWGRGHVTPVAMAEREKLAELGVLSAALLVDRAQLRIVQGPALEGRGLSREELAHLPEVALDARAALDSVSPQMLGDTAFVREELARVVRRAVKARTGKRPGVLPLVLYL